MPRAEKGTFIGYSTNQKGYMFLTHDGRITVSHNAVFNEQSFMKSNLAVAPTIKKDIQRSFIPDSLEHPEVTNRDLLPSVEAIIRPTHIVTEELNNLRTHVENKQLMNTDLELSPVANVQEHLITNDQATRISGSNSIPVPNVSTLLHLDTDSPSSDIASSSDKDEEEYQVEAIIKSREKDGLTEYLVKWEGYDPTAATWEPLSNLTNCEDAIQFFKEKSTGSNSEEYVQPLAYALSATHASNIKDPNGYKEAMQSKEAEQWKIAIQEEYDSLIKQGTWGPLEPLPQGKRALKGRWVLKTKRHADGTPYRYKARHVLQGFRQRKGFDYNDTYAPVAKLSSLRMLLAVKASNNLDLVQMDVKTAFLHGKIDIEDIFVLQAEGFVDPNQEHLVRRLLKSQYGIKQASRIWNQTLDKVLREKCGLIRSKRDNCLYYKFTEEETTVILVYVDDMLGMTSTKIDFYTKIMKDAKIDI
jgi:hypothetical protein